ncbi:MAG: hypothetical protein V3V28_09360 [Polaribacter sp.]|uniref:hypothetical protein n=1 Tax=Polaribacter sp. TaxID=1920175 RepID=UPI002F35BEF1
MRSSFDILDALYELINKPVVTDVISGKIYSGNIPDKDQNENITIKTLNNPNRYLQVGYINLNIHIKEIQSGRPNLARFKEILNIIIPLVDDVKTGTFTFQIDDDKGVFKNQELDSMYFYNLKLKFQTI